MERYMPLTGIDLIQAPLIIDNQALLKYFVPFSITGTRMVTQVLENIAYRA